MSVPNSPEAPWAVGQLNDQVKNWIQRLGFIWVEGQVTQVNMKSTWRFSYITLRDVNLEASVSLTVETSALKNLATPVKDGDRIVVHGKPSFYSKRGSFSLWVTEIRQVGIGQLLAQIEQLKKAPLPFLPTTVGLITGRGSAAERDVMEVAKRRWPAVRFRVISTAVQGPKTVPQVVDALHELERDPAVDVIIVARGGGSVEDLLPFSEEALVREVSRLRTPVVSAIGHEPDNPLLDYVADVRAATPTDAAKTVVPDVVQELRIISEARQRGAGALRNWVAHERKGLTQIRTRPVMADPSLPVTRQKDIIAEALQRKDRALGVHVRSLRSSIESLKAQVNALGPSQTLARGYSIVQVIPRDKSGAQVVTTVDQVDPGSQLRIRVPDGSITAAAMGVQAAPGGVINKNSNTTDSTGSTENSTGEV